MAPAQIDVCMPIGGPVVPLYPERTGEKYPRCRETRKRQQECEMFSVRGLSLAVFLFLTTQVVLTQNPDPIPPLLSQLTDSNQTTRMSSFENLLSLNPSIIISSDPGSIRSSIAWLLSTFPSDSASINSSLIALLKTETSVRHASLRAFLQGKGTIETEDVTEYYAA